MWTLQDQIAATNNRPSGFDYLRIILSVSVIAWHGILVCYGRNAETPFWTGPLRPLVYLIVPSFFALSGFLVAGSLERNDLPSFLTLRGLRIFPALAVEVFVSAIVIGPILTTASLRDYVTSPLFWEYFENIAGRIHYILPGVFGGVPAGPNVNVQLWTVPHELECYIAISVISLIGLYRRPKLLMAILAGACFIVFGRQMTTGSYSDFDGHAPGGMILLAFLFGVALYALRSRIPCSAPSFVLSLVAGCACLSQPQLVYLAPLPVTYATVFIGLQNPPRMQLLKGADYSYGMYLYGFPVQQTIGYLFPATRVWALNFGISLILAGGLAFLSWHCVESKVMESRKAALKIVGRLTQEFWEALAPLRLGRVRVLASFLRPKVYKLAKKNPT